MTGPKPKNKESQSSVQVHNQQEMMEGLMRLMHEQIYIAKENCQKRFEEVLKNNARMIKELQEKIVNNTVVLR